MKQKTTILLKRALPSRLIRTANRALGLLRRVFSYAEFDSESYWRGRSKYPGQMAVLWTNEGYNELFRLSQRKIIRSYLPTCIEREFNVLDVGCGIGVVAAMIAECAPMIRVDAVDFEEMIKVARTVNSSRQITYIESRAEDYFSPSKRYDLVISSGAFSAIRDIEKMKKAVANCVGMLRPGGTVLMMDPFHRSFLLARVRFSSREVCRYASELGLILTLRTGFLFWPFREWLANSDYSGVSLERKFHQGERILAAIGPHFWADYKVLVFRKSGGQDHE